MPRRQPGRVLLTRYRASRAAGYAREVLAKSLCGTCPVQAECRAYALAAGETFGVWGGAAERDRS